MNQFEHGVNELTTDYTKPHSTKEIEALKPIQHPDNIYSEHSAIVSHKVPPKNLTPYNQIPDNALAQINLRCKDSPQGARSLNACFLGAPNAGKSSLMNKLVKRNVSAVSDKYNTTDEAVLGVFTDIERKTQIVLTDTPGASKASKSMRSNLLVTKAWNVLQDNEQAIFVVDAAKRMSFEVKQALIRLNKISKSINPHMTRAGDLIQNSDHMTEKQLMELIQTEDERQIDGGLPCILVMNKVDLVTNKRKMRGLQAEVNDLARFDEVFHVSCETGFGIEAFKEYLLESAKEQTWRYDPSMVSSKSPVEWAEEALKQACMEKYFQEIPYQIGIKVVSWVPKLNGELRIDYQIDVRNEI